MTGPGLVAVPCRPDMARHVAFYKKALHLEMPPGSRLDIYPGFFAHYNRNTAVKEALAEGLEWVFFVDDDQELQPDALMRLLAHDVDVVGVNLLTKEPPFSPFMFFATDEGGAGFADVLEQQRGLQQVAAMGMGGVLVKIDVFKRLPFPWFEVSDYLKTDDMYFCHEATKAGIKLHIDVDVTSGHIVNSTIWPFWDKTHGCWVTAIAMKGGTFYVPAAKMDAEFAAWKAERLGRVVITDTGVKA